MVLADRDAIALPLPVALIVVEVLNGEIVLDPEKHEDTVVRVTFDIVVVETDRVDLALGRRLAPELEFEHGVRRDQIVDIRALASVAVDLQFQAAVQHLVLGEVLIVRSEEHTSELQSLMRISYAVFCLKKKKQ